MGVSLTPLGRIGLLVWYGMAEFPKVGSGGGLALLYHKLFLVEFKSHARAARAGASVRWLMRPSSFLFSSLCGISRRIPALIAGCCSTSNCGHQRTGGMENTDHDGG